MARRFSAAHLVQAFARPGPALLLGVPWSLALRGASRSHSLVRNEEINAGQGGLPQGGLQRGGLTMRCEREWMTSIPAHLPTLGSGAHRPGSPTPCAMEAASWIVGGSWSDHPESVHDTIAAVARSVNDALDDAERQSIWPFILSSLGTARPRRLILGWRLDRFARSVMRRQGPTLATWRAVLERFAILADVELNTRALLDARLEAASLLERRAAEARAVDH
jgi:hypothetical protein